MNKNTVKKCIRQLDEAAEAIERLVECGIIDEDNMVTFSNLVSLKNEVWEVTGVKNDKY